MNADKEKPWVFDRKRFEIELAMSQRAWGVGFHIPKVRHRCEVPGCENLSVAPGYSKCQPHRTAFTPKYP